MRHIKFSLIIVTRAMSDNLTKMSGKTYDHMHILQLNKTNNSIIRDLLNARGIGQRTAILHARKIIQHSFHK